MFIKKVSNTKKTKKMKNLRIKISSEFDLVDYSVFRDFTASELQNEPQLPEDEIKRGKLVATFVDEEIATSFIQYYNRNENVTNRPTIKHHFFDQNWRIRFMSHGEIDDGECDFFIEGIEPKSNSGKIEIMMEDFGEHSGYPREQKLADARLISQAPVLVEVAEMFVDYLRTRGNEKGLPYQIAINALNKL